MFLKILLCLNSWTEFEIRWLRWLNTRQVKEEGATKTGFGYGEGPISGKSYDKLATGKWTSLQEEMISRKGRFQRASSNKKPRGNQGKDSVRWLCGHRNLPASTKAWAPYSQTHKIERDSTLTRPSWPLCMLYGTPVYTQFPKRLRNKWKIKGNWGKVETKWRAKPLR